MKTMKVAYAKAYYAGVAALLVAMLALSGCGGPAAGPGAALPTSAPQARATQVPGPSSTPVPTPVPISSPAPAGTTGALPPAAPAMTEPAPPVAGTAPAGEPGFVTEPFPLPSGFPILPDAKFVAYNPDYDPCLYGQRDCAPGRITYQVWLYEVPVPVNSMAPVAPHVMIANRYADLLRQAGYNVEIQIARDVAILTFTSSGKAPVISGTIAGGPPVSNHTPPPNMMLVGLRISIEHEQMK